jgi:demethylmenaquinone methyltransferase/2-methoxy-6-polyprenyl-1,4-benzoquinol methylase
MIGPYRKNAHARGIFDGIADRYEGPAQAFSMFQYGRWRRELVSQLGLGPEASVLDVCTGTGLVASEIAGTLGCRVVGIDLCERMLQQARQNLRSPDAPPVHLVTGLAEGLPFADHSFDAVVFTFLLRYVEDIPATLFELARVLRPGGQMLSLEFFVPQNPVMRALWLLHTRLVLPLGASLLSPGWRRVGTFLGPSITEFYRTHSVDTLSRMWTQAGVGNVKTRVHSFGGAIIMWGEKEASGEN